LHSQRDSPNKQALRLLHAVGCAITSAYLHPGNNLALTAVLSQQLSHALSTFFVRRIKARLSNLSGIK
jgi:hypothetical protein